VQTYEEERVLRGQDSPIAAASFAADGQRVITAGRDGTAILWDLQNGQVLARLSESAPGDEPDTEPKRTGPIQPALQRGNWSKDTSSWSHGPRSSRLATRGC
jgi:WD40 repeat protein